MCWWVTREFYRSKRIDYQTQIPAETQSGTRNSKKEVIIIRVLGRSRAVHPDCK